MTNPVGPSYAPPPAGSAPPIIIDVPSPVVFDLLRNVVNVIHTLHANQALDQGGRIHHHFRPLGPVLLSAHHLSEMGIDELPSPGTSARAPSLADPKPDSPPLAAVHPGKGEPQRVRVDLPPGFKVPDLTDHTTPRTKDEKLRYQRMVMDMLDKIARIVKDIKITKGNDRQILEQTALGKKAPGEILPHKKAPPSPHSPQGVEKQELREENVHQIELIIETIAPDGQVEQIAVKRGEMEELVENLETLLGQEATLDMQPEALLAVEERLSPEHEQGLISEKPPLPPASRHLSPKGSKLPKSAQEAASETRAAAQSPQNLKGLVPGVSSVQASYMPYSATGQNRQDKGAGDEAFKVEQVEAAEGVSRFDGDHAENRSSNQAPAEVAALAKKSRKSSRQSSVQEAVDSAKEQRAKKTPAPRIQDERVVPAHGKFTVEQLRSVRRRGAKEGSSGGGGASGAETHKLIDVLYMVLSAVVCGAQTIFEITAFIESREKWFSTVLGLRSGLPSSRLVSKLIVSFNASQLTEMMAVWMQEVRGAPLRSGLASLMVCETPEGAIFSQERNGASSTMELCLPRLLQFFEMRGVVMLLSTGKASRDNLARVLAGGAEYIYDCGQEPIPHESEVLTLFEQAVENPKNTPGVLHTDSYLEGQEYLQIYETRLDAFTGSIKSISQVLSEIVTPEGRDESIQFFTSSLAKQSIWLFELLRAQRNLESKMLWTVNLSMRGKHGDEAAFATREFLALVRRYAVNMLLRDQSFKAPVHVKQQRAAKESEYLMKLLKL